MIGQAGEVMSCAGIFLFQAEDGIRDLVRSRGLGDVYKRQVRDAQQGQQRIRRLDVEISPQLGQLDRRRALL